MKLGKHSRPIRPLSPLWSAYAALGLIFFASLLAYATGLAGAPLSYGSSLHKFSRLHVLLVHLGLGVVLLLAALEIFGKIEEKPRWQLHHLSHFLLLPALSSGLLMEAIERYPNPAVTTHLVWALLAYSLFLAYSLYVWTGHRRRVQCAGALALALLFFQTARLGGLLHKGQDFFPW